MAAYLLPDDLSSVIIAFDLTISENHEANATITEHPVEQGSNIADHVRAEPKVLTLETFVTNTPATDLGGRGSIQTIELDNGRYKVQALKFDEPFDRIKEVHDALLDLRTRGQSMSIVTSTQTYDTMILVSLSYTKTTAGSGNFNLGFKEIRTVTTSSVTAPKPAEKRGNPKQKKGGQSTKPVDKKDATKSKSLALKGLQALGIATD